MEPYESVDAYRRRLLASLHVQPCQDHEVEFDSLQVFVNHECVGTVACDGIPPRPWRRLLSHVPSKRWKSERRRVYSSAAYARKICA